MRTGKIIRKFMAKNSRVVILRTPRWDDLDDLTEFINSLVDEGAYIDPHHTRLTREQEAEWLGHFLVDLENDQVFSVVAEVDAKVVANSELRRKGRYSRHVGEIGIAIRRDYRDVGIGTEMLRTLIDYARMIQLRLLVLRVFSANERAIHVYEKVGFKETGRIPGYFYRDGSYIDEITMALVL